MYLTAAFGALIFVLLIVALWLYWADLSARRERAKQALIAEHLDAIKRCAGAMAGAPAPADKLAQAQEMATHLRAVRQLDPASVAVDRALQRVEALEKRYGADTVAGKVAELAEQVDDLKSAHAALQDAEGHRILH